MNSLSETFNKSKTDITWGITLVLMFRSVGSIVFGIAADRFGRKWPFVLNVLMFSCLEIVCSPHIPRLYPSFIIDLARLRQSYQYLVLTNQGTSFTQTYTQFLICRALFGVAMGGLYGNAAATALEDCPDEARGLMSGILQQGVSYFFSLFPCLCCSADVKSSCAPRTPFTFFFILPIVLIFLRGFARFYSVKT